jgi:hypothetical protein
LVDNFSLSPDYKLIEHLLKTVDFVANVRYAGFHGFIFHIDYRFVGVLVRSVALALVIMDGHMTYSNV